MQVNYAAVKRPKYKEHVKYTKEDFLLDPSKSQELALAQNFLLYSGVDDIQIKLRGWDDAKYLSDLLVSFKRFVPPE